MEMIDEWGNTWRRIGGRTKGEVSHGVVEEGWECLDSYQWPDVTAPEIWQQAEERCAAFHRDGYYVFGSVNWPFAAARSMRRLENFLYDLAADRHSAMRLLNGAANVVEKEIEGYARIGADGVVTWEDWGMQDRLLVSPTMWREVFKPLFKRLCDAAHAGGMDVWLHSCGHVTDVIEDLIQVGVEVCMFDQPELHGIDFLARNFGGRMAFCTPVDIQRTLQTRDIGRIEAAARQYVETLGAFGGASSPTSTATTKGSASRRNTSRRRAAPSCGTAIRRICCVCRRNSGEEAATGRKPSTRKLWALAQESSSGRHDSRPPRCCGSHLRRRRECAHGAVGASLHRGRCRVRPPQPGGDRLRRGSLPRRKTFPRPARSVADSHRPL
jgi:hypothetical protein